MNSTTNPRPTRAQHRLLVYIEAFIKQHGYGPSYREIMRALDFKSVSTVAVHIDGLVAAGQLRKKGRSARSLEVVKAGGEVADKNAEHTAWLLKRARAIEKDPATTPEDVIILQKALALLGITDNRLTDKQ